MRDIEIPSDITDMGEFVTRVSDGFGRIQGDRIGPFDHPDGVAADQPFQLAHTLGERPALRLIVEDPGTSGKGVYATNEDRAAWDASTITVRSADTGNKQISIRVVPAVEESS